MILKTVFHVNTPELLATDLDNFNNCVTILSFSKPPSLDVFFRIAGAGACYS
jgi:hypothetical protein